MGNSVTKLVFQAPPSSYTEDHDDLLWIKTDSGKRVPAYHVQHEQTPKYTIIFSHGNAEDLGHVAYWCEELADRLQVGAKPRCYIDCNVFTYEYCSYGLDNDFPSEALVYEHAKAAIMYLFNDHGVDFERMILYGRSLGSGPSVHLASQWPVRAVILQTPLLSIFRVAANFKVTLPGDMFCNIDKIHLVKCPVFVYHGTQDSVVPFWHGSYLYKRLPYPYQPWWIKGADHNDIEAGWRKELIMKLKEFMEFLDISA